MAEQKLRDDLAEARRQISALDSDDEAKAGLQAVIDSIEAKLEAKEVHLEVQGLSEQLSEIKTQFQRDHPILTGVLNDVMTSLSRMGI